MWIIPKNSPIFPSALVTEALTSDLKELSEMCEQSVMWRSKTSSSTTWLRRLKRASSTTVLSTQTLKHSPGNSLVGEWTSFLEASLVSHFQQQEEEKAVKTQDTCGPTLQMESSVWADLPLFTSRMSRESLVPKSREKTGQIQREHQFCSMSLESWKEWVTKQRQAYSQRVKSVRPINERECLYLVSEMTSHKQVLISSMNSSNEMIHTSNWATPRANKTTSENYETWTKRNQKWGKNFGMPLGLQVEVQPIPHLEGKDSIGTNRQELRWATPCTMDHLTPKSQETLMRQATTIRKGRKAPSNLREQVDPVAMEVYKQANWATPMAGTKNHMGGSIEYYILSPNVGKQVDLNGQVKMQNQENYTGKLNPRWVEMLMGLPIGWTMPSCTNPVTIEQMSLECLGMELCQIPPQEHSESFGENWSTPPSSQRGETLYPYLNRMESRYKRGYKDFFAPTLQIQAEAAELGIDIKDELNKVKDKHSQNWPTPNARDYKDTLNTVPPSINQTRGYSLGQALAEELNKKQNE